MSRPADFEKGRKMHPRVNETYCRRWLASAWLCAVLAIHAPARVSAAEPLPVVFVPGTAGSQLSVLEANGAKRPLWLSMRLTDPSPGGVDLMAVGPGGTALVANDLLRDLRIRVRLD